MPATPTQTIVVTSMVRVDRPAAYSLVFEREVAPARSGWDARVDVIEDGNVVATIHFDRMDHEAAWHTSAQFRAGCSMPASGSATGASDGSRR